MIPFGFDADKLVELIPRRRAIRVYDGRLVTKSGLDRLTRLVSECNPFDDVHIAVVDAVPEGFFKGIVGSYFRIEGAPSSLVLAVSGNDPDRYWRLGYLTELVVLEATSIGLSTCWATGSFSRKVVDEVVSLDSDAHLVGVVSLGYASETPKPQRRKPLARIAPGFDSWPRWAVRGVEAARLAPSAVNRQPWRFTCIDGGKVGLSMDAGILGVSQIPRLDCGIAAAHFELGANDAGVEGIWSSAGPNSWCFEPVGTASVEFSRPEISRRITTSPMGAHIETRD